MKNVGLVYAGLVMFVFSGCRVSQDDELPAYRIMAAFNSPGNGFPPTLEQTSLFANLSEVTPRFGLVPYDVNAPLWTDGAKKKRWIFVPPEEQVSVNPAKPTEMVYPAGTLLVKHFSTDQGDPVETRVYAKKSDLKWYFGTYVWEQGREGPAVLSRNPRTVERGGLSFRIPSENECQLCHDSQVKSDPTLGLEAPQLAVKPGEGLNNLEAIRKTKTYSIDALRLLESADPIPSPADSMLPIETRARAYLAINCSPCHQPGGAAQEKKMDLRFATPLGSTDLLANNRIVPGRPEESLVIKKFTATTERMPPLSVRQDPLGREVLTEWIRQWPSGKP